MTDRLASDIPQERHGLASDASPTLADAIRLALEAHAGSTDSSGAPAFLHPIRVMSRMLTEAEMMAAVLHDLIEDTDITLDRLREQRYPPEVVDAVDALTHREGEPFDDYIERASGNALARRIKIVDLEDNMDLRQSVASGAEDPERLGRLRRAWERLVHLERAGDAGGPGTAPAPMH